MTICVGTKVRSFDFDRNRAVTGPDACYVEGVVESVVTEGFDCPRYKVRVTCRIFSGEPAEGADFVFPPVNGTPTLFGDVTNNVVSIDEDPADYGAVDEDPAAYKPLPGKGW
jgi:hypothetical protein